VKRKLQKISRLKQQLLVVLQQEAEHIKKENKNDSGQFNESFFGDAFGASSFPRSEPLVSARLQEQIDILNQDLTMPISDRIIGPRYKEGTWGGLMRDGQQEYSKEQFMQTVSRYQSDRRELHNINLEGLGWTIPSLDGIKFMPLSVIGQGPLNRGGIQYAGSGVNLRRCRIQTLGSVEFPPVIDELDIGQNDIIHLQGVTFPPCRHLRLNSNLISSLSECIFPEGIETINLVDNFISNFDDLNVIALPMSLRNINLSGNPMTEGYTQDEMEVLNRKILYKIAKERNSAKRSSHVGDQRQPEPSAPPLSVNELLGLEGGSIKTTSRRSKNKRYKKYKKTNKKRKPTYN
jgi:hypothetical protein